MLEAPPLLSSADELLLEAEIVEALAECKER